MAVDMPLCANIDIITIISKQIWESRDPVWSTHYNSGNLRSLWGNIHVYVNYDEFHKVLKVHAMSLILLSNISRVFFWWHDDRCFTVVWQIQILLFLSIIRSTYRVEYPTRNVSASFWLERKSRPESAHLLTQVVVTKLSVELNMRWKHIQL